MLTRHPTERNVLDPLLLCDAGGYREHLRFRIDRNRILEPRAEGNADPSRTTATVQESSPPIEAMFGDDVTKDLGRIRNTKALIILSGSFE